MIELHPPGADSHVQAYAALRGELEGIRQQILEHLLQPLAVGRDAAPEIWIDMDFKRQLPRFGFVPERPCHHVDQVREKHLLGVDGDSAGFNLR